MSIEAFLYKHNDVVGVIALWTILLTVFGGLFVATRWKIDKNERAGTSASSALENHWPRHWIWRRSADWARLLPVRTVAPGRAARLAEGCQRYVETIQPVIERRYGPVYYWLHLRDGPNVVYYRIRAQLMSSRDIPSIAERTAFLQVDEYDRVYSLKVDHILFDYLAAQKAWEFERDDNIQFGLFLMALALLLGIPIMAFGLWMTRRAARRGPQAGS
jgi:hypothetical protein